MMLKSWRLYCLYHMSYRYLGANESKVTQLEMQDGSKLDNLKSTILKGVVHILVLRNQLRGGFQMITLV